MKKTYLQCALFALLFSSCSYKIITISGHNEKGEPFVERARYYGGCEDTIFYNWRGEQTFKTTDHWKVVDSVFLVNKK